MNTKPKVRIVDVPALCQDWTVYQPHHSDRLSEQSAKQLLDSNKAREVWGCAKNENAAAG